MADQEAHLDALRDTAQPRPSKRGDRGPRRGGKPMDREVQVSKALSKLLRHQADSAGIKLDKEGFAPLDRVLSWGPIRSLAPTLAEIKDIVSTNAKQRFTLKLANPNPDTNTDSPDSPDSPDSAASYLIRANQGHSIQVDEQSLFKPILATDADFPQRVIHGTYFAFWSAIVEDGGLRPMGRGHVHCADRTPEEGAVSGMRQDAELLVEIDVRASLRDGVTWWRSDNGVILTDGGEDGVLATRYFKSVTSRTVDVGVLWEDGVKVADLPPGLKFRVPGGKRGNSGGGGRGGGRGRGRGNSRGA